MFDALLDRFAAAEHHRGGGAHTELVRREVHVDPLLSRALQAADPSPHFVVKDLRAAAGNRIQTGVAQAGDGRLQIQPADRGDVLNLGRREAMQPDLRETALDGAEHLLVPLDLQIGMQAALHQHARAAEIEGLLNLLEDDVDAVDVAFRVAHRTVEGAEAAVLRAEVGVVDIAVDDVGDDAFGMELAAQRVGGHADPNEVVRVKQADGFGWRHHSLASPCKRSSIRTISSNRRA